MPMAVEPTFGWGATAQSCELGDNRLDARIASVPVVIAVRVTLVAKAR